MAIIGFNTSSDAVSFVTFIDLCPGAIFYMTDNPYKNSTGFCTSGEEFCIQFTVGSSTVTAGTKITYTNASYPSVGTVALSPSGATISASYTFTGTAGTNDGFNSGGDNIFIFSGSYSSPSFACAFKNSGNYTNIGSVSCSNRDHAELPSTLTLGQNAMVGCVNVGMKYNCSLVSGTPAALSAAINNLSNWTCSGSAVTLPPACSFVVTGASSTCLLLPVEILSFYAKRENKQALLVWETASENNNDFFTLEKSRDGRSFEEMLKVKGAGKSETTIEYTAVDKDPFEENTYYRLKQTDYNGNSSYSKIISLNYEKETKGSLIIYPNPFSSQTELKFDATKESEQNIEVYNYLGTLVYNKKVQIQEGENKTELDLSELSQGIYFVRLSKEITQNKNELIKIIKL